MELELTRSSEEMKAESDDNKKIKKALRSLLLFR